MLTSDDDAPGDPADALLSVLVPRAIDRLAARGAAAFSPEQAERSAARFRAWLDGHAAGQTGQ